MSGKRSGFTLIEVLTAMAILTLVIGGLAALILSSGRVMRALDDRDPTILIEALSAVERIKKELRDSPVVPSVAFEGKKDSVVFPKLIKRSIGEALNADFILGQTQSSSSQAFHYGPATYYFDRDQEAIVKRVGDQPEEIFFDGVTDCEFSYAIGSVDGNGDKTWQSQTPGQGTYSRLYAMNIRWVLKAGGGAPSRQVQQTFVLFREHPLGGLIREVSGVQ